MCTVYLLFCLLTTNFLDITSGNVYYVRFDFGYVREHSQEPITRSIQLPCVRATAFSQVGLFLDRKVFSVKISVSDDLRHQAYKI